MEKKRSKYIQKALAIFKEEGLRMSMDELAAKMVMSKKTLYNNFGSKEELLSKCIHSIFRELDKSMMLMYNDDRNAIECLVESFKEIRLFMADLSPIFLNDLQKLYPEMVSSSHTCGFGQFSEKLTMNLSKGIQEGLYREDLDIKLISKYFSFAVFGFYFLHVRSENSSISLNYFETIIQLNLRSLVTDKGRLQLQ